MVRVVVVVVYVSVVVAVFVSVVVAVYVSVVIVVVCWFKCIFNNLYVYALYKYILRMQYYVYS